VGGYVYGRKREERPTLFRSGFYCAIIYRSNITVRCRKEMYIIHVRTLVIYYTREKDVENEPLKNYI